MTLMVISQVLLLIAIVAGIVMLADPPSKPEHRVNGAEGDESAPKLS